MIPALFVAFLFGTVLGYRRDYLGHFAAGYGGSFVALMLLLAGLPKARFQKNAPFDIAVVCLACVALGAVFEATLFRIAKFDEVDFCNQSLGAILAGLAALVASRDSKPHAAAIAQGLVSGLAFLQAGFIYALL